MTQGKGSLECLDASGRFSQDPGNANADGKRIVALDQRTIDEDRALEVIPASKGTKPILRVAFRHSHQKLATGVATLGVEGRALGVVWD